MFLRDRIRLPQTVVALSASALLLAGTAAFAQVAYDAQIPFSFSSPSLTSPAGVAVAPDGTVYVADIQSGFPIRANLVQITPKTGTVGGASGGAADIAATGTQLTPTGVTMKEPTAVAVDSTGALYVADPGAKIVFKIASPESSISPAATAISYGGTAPTALAVDSANNLYIADKTAGAIYEAGVATPLVTGYQPVGLAVDSAGDIYFADAGTSEIYEYNVSSKTTSLFLANSGGTNFSFSVQPVGMGVDPAGDVYVLDSGNDRLIEATSSTNTFDVPFSSILKPGSLALSSTGNIYLTDDSNEAVDEIYYNSNPVNFGLINAGTPSPEVMLNYNFINGEPTVAYYQSVQGDSTGEFSNPNASTYPCGTSFGSSTVPAGTQCSFLMEATYLAAKPGLRNGADGLSYGSGATEGYLAVPTVGIDVAGSLALYPGTQSVLSQSSQPLYEPQALAVSGDGGWLFIGDEGGQLNTTTGAYSYPHPAVWAYKVSGGTISSSPSLVGEEFTYPVGMVLDAAGNLYVADYSGYVRKIPPVSNWSTAGANLSLPAGMLNNPISIAIDPSGNIYIGNAGPAGPLATASNPGYIVKVPADGGPAVKLNYTVNGTPVIFPEGLTTDVYGNLYIADGGDAENVNNTGGVDVVTASNGVVSQSSAISAVSFGVYGYNGNSYSLNEPSSLSFDAAGDLYVLDGYDQRVLVVPISYSSGTTPTPDSNGVGMLGNGASGISNLLVTPSSMVVWPGGQNITIADLGFTPTTGPASPTQVITLEAMNTTIDVSAGSGTLAGVNVGNKEITFAAPTPGGTNSSYFSMAAATGDCGTSGTTVSPGVGNACPVVIDLTKGVGTKDYSATFTMNGNAADDYSTLGNVITVTAEPSEPVAQISTSGGFLAGSTITVTLENLGSDPLQISNIQLLNPNDAILNGGTCGPGVSLSLDQTCTVIVAFDSGSYSYGTVAFTDNNDDVGNSVQDECVYDFYGFYTGGESGACGGGGGGGGIFGLTSGPVTTGLGGTGALGLSNSGQNNSGTAPGSLDSQGQTGSSGFHQGSSSSGDAAPPVSTIQTGNTPQVSGSYLPLGFVAPSVPANDDSVDDNSTVNDSSTTNDNSTGSGQNGKKKDHKSGGANSGGTNANANGSGDSAPQQ